MTGEPRLAEYDQVPARPRMRRVLTRWDLILYGLVILTPTAPYPVYGIIQQQSQGHAALSYLVAMVAMLFTAASYAKMATAFPSAGSTYTYVQETLNPYLGFVAGWAMILDYFLIPLESIVYAAITSARVLPAVPYAVWVVVFTLATTLINIRGIRLMTRANTLMMVVMTTCAVLFAGLAARYVILHHGVGALFSTTSFFHSSGFSLPPVILGAAIATMSYIGFDAISTLAEDSLHPQRDIGFSTILVCILQTAICVATVHLAALAWPDYSSFPQPDTAILDLGQHIGGSFLFGFLTIVLLVAGIAGALTGQAGASRLLFAMGRDGLLPRTVFARLHARYATPAGAIWIVAAISFTGALVARFEIAVELLNFGAFTGFILVNCGVIGHFFIHKRERGGTALFHNLLFPLAGAAVCTFLWLNLSRHAKIVGFLWLAIGVLYIGFLTRGFTKAPKRLSFEEPA